MSDTAIIPVPLDEWNALVERVNHLEACQRHMQSWMDEEFDYDPLWKKRTFWEHVKAFIFGDYR